MPSQEAKLGTARIRRLNKWLSQARKSKKEEAGSSWDGEPEEAGEAFELIELLFCFAFSAVRLDDWNCSTYPFLPLQV